MAEEAKEERQKAIRKIRRELHRRQLDELIVFNYFCHINRPSGP